MSTDVLVPGVQAQAGDPKLTPGVSPLFMRWVKFTVTDSQGVAHSFECEVTQAGIGSTGGDAVSITTLCPTGSYSENTQRSWNLNVTAVQDVTDIDSLMLFLLLHDGETASFVYYPKVDKAGNPAGYGMKGTVTLTPPDNFGNAASGAYATFTATLPLQGKWTLIDATGAVVGGAATGAAAGSPGSWTPAGSIAPLNLAALIAAAPAIVATPATAWTVGQYVITGDGNYAQWNATAWVNAADKANVKQGMIFPPDSNITASDATNAAKLAGLGYVAVPATAWTTGQKMLIGGPSGFAFNWSGTAWAAGAHA